MAAPHTPAARGRPPSITRERIADAGIAMTLPKLSIVGVAGLLGVSHIGLYKHVANLAALRSLVAEVIFERWQPPAVDAGRGSTLQADLLAFHRSLRALVDQNPGLAPFLATHGAKTEQMVLRIQQHQAAFAAAHGLSVAQAAWLLSTVAYHCVALADTVYSRHLPIDTDRRPYDAAAAEAEFERGMQALIDGAVAMLSQVER
ncbi:MULTISPECIES: TetR family transcriptional regulator [Stenotrophomonas]|uniref:TetR/AcrR family transcriptional regulator n=1 Tax=Stenotrophomonas TaxID=40323 RepID=UPI000D541985|nr:MULTISPECIES: TetR family transcriptional regulator [Stenotrophomonas]AWH29289.1 TetR family transcriptional regulator [Stenotrophomonas sp. YAU14A_MKIMI4_1]AWH33301.1 TetR family transcriptional regulator [Stenotrophomonas sp. SAU14A_NAIMI4_8]